MADDRSRPFTPRDRGSRPSTGPGRPAWTPRPGGAPGPRPGGFQPPRPGGFTPGPRPGGFTPAPTPFTPSRPAGGDETLSVRLREGDREVEISGSPAVCRQLLEDLPALFGRLRGERTRVPAITLPPPSPAAASTVAAPEPEDAATATPQALQPARGRRAERRERAAADRDAEVDDAELDADSDADDDQEPETTALDGAVLTLLRSSRTPLTIAEIRRRLPEEAGAQAVRRILERAGSAVVNAGGRPAAYRAR